MVKKSLLIISALLFSALVFSQVRKPWNISGFDNKKIHFGFSVGLNTMDFRIKRSLKPYVTSGDTLFPDLSTIMPPGFQVQIVSDLRLGENLNLRFLPGISFGQRSLSFYRLSDRKNDLTVDLPSAFLDFPMSLKYRAKRLNNYRPYILGGLNYRYDMSSRNDEEIIIQTKPGDLYIETGLGVDWYLPFFKLSTEVKVSTGLRDILLDRTNDGPQYLNALDGLRSYIVCLSFHFE